jgi:predicted NAD-dependent protein-ADP-ribosyltransferase YbiA (DUF1768 family)
VEVAYQASKTLDRMARKKVAALANPVMAKMTGKKLKLRPDWDDVKLKVMEDLLRQEFAPGSELAAQLVATSDAHIEEANRWGDRFLGDLPRRGGEPPRAAPDADSDGAAQGDANVAARG